MKSVLMAVLLSWSSLLWSGVLLADTSGQDGVAIRELMQHTWDKPDAPLQVEPVVTADDYALASWTQGERGGRAILARRDGRWQVLVCTGDGAKDVATLQQTGMPVAVAETLVADLVKAEENISPERREKFSLFGADVPMGASSHHQHHAAPAH
jgi:hypothetical protein